MNEQACTLHDSLSFVCWQFDFDIRKEISKFANRIVDYFLSQEIIDFFTALILNSNPQWHFPCSFVIQVTMSYSFNIYYYITDVLFLWTALECTTSDWCGLKLIMRCLISIGSHIIPVLFFAINIVVLEIDLRL